MAEKLPWIPWYARDFIMDGNVRAYLDDAQKWWYLALLVHQWENLAVPRDPGAVLGIVGPHPNHTRKQWAHFIEVMPKFFPPIDEIHGQNARLEEIREKHVGIHERAIERARKAGLASGQARQPPQLKAS